MKLLQAPLLVLKIGARILLWHRAQEQKETMDSQDKYWEQKKHVSYTDCSMKIVLKYLILCGCVCDCGCDCASPAHVRLQD